MPPTSQLREGYGFRVLRRNYQNLALGVLDHSLRDATGTREIAPETQREAREFIYCEEAEFWAEAAGVNIWKLRQEYKRRMQATSRG